MARAKKSKKSNKIIIPSLKDVQARMVIPAGAHTAKVKAVEPGEGDEHPYFKWTFEITKGKAKGQQPKPYYTSLAPAALFNIKSVLAAIGYKIPKGEFELDMDAVIDEELTIQIDHEVYEGRKQSVVVGFGDDAADEDEDEDEAEDADEDEDEDEAEEADEEELDEDEINEMTQAELEDLASTHDWDINFKKLKTLQKQRKAVIKAAKEEGLL